MPLKSEISSHLNHRGSVGVIRPPSLRLCAIPARAGAYFGIPYYKSFVVRAIPARGCVGVGRNESFPP